MIDKDKLKRRFSRNAKSYDKYANVQKKMGDKLIENIKNDNSNIKNILEIGCGTGYVTQRLVNHFPNAQVTAIDIAPGMIEHVKSTIECDRVNFICGDIEEMNLNNKYDLIISNATFQWFNHLNKTVSKLIRLLDKNGTLCFSTFGKDTFKELHEAFYKAKKALNISEQVTPSQNFYSSNKLQEICNDIINKDNLNDIKVNASESYDYEYFNCCTDFLFSIKKIGANNSQSNRTIMPPDFIEKVMEIYDKDYLENDKVVATYHTLYFQIKNNV